MFGRLSSVTFLLLLLAGASAQAQPARDKPKYTPDQELILASFQLDVKRVQTLLKEGANPNARVRVSPFVINSDFGNNSFEGHGLSLLWSFRSYKWTPLLAVAYSRRVPAPKNPKGVLPKDVDSQVLQERDQRRVAIAKLLINQQAKLDMDDSLGTTPLNVSLTNEYWPLSLLLIRSGADPNLKPRFSPVGEQTATSVHLATRNPNVLKVVLKHGASLTVKDATGHTPLDWAAYDYSVDSIKLLISAGADVNARDANGVTPLYWVRNSKVIDNRDELKKKIIKLLYEAGARE